MYRLGASPSWTPHRKFRPGMDIRKASCLMRTDHRSLLASPYRLVLSNGASTQLLVGRGTCHRRQLRTVQAQPRTPRLRSLPETLCPSQAPGPPAHGAWWWAPHIRESTLSAPLPCKRHSPATAATSPPLQVNSCPPHTASPQILNMLHPK